MTGIHRAAKMYTFLVYWLTMIWYSAVGMNTTAILNNIYDNYDDRLRPNDSGPPVSVRIGIYVESIESIQETTMDFSVTMYLRMFWQDPRLSFTGDESIILKSKAVDRIWVPDVFFLYEKRASLHEVTQPNRLLRVEPDGSVAYSARVSATLLCNMQLEKFPMDSQNCTIIFCSYAYSTRDVLLYMDEKSIDIDEGITISKFSLVSSKYENKDEQYLLGNFSSPRCHFYFNRQMESYLLTVYIPTILLVSIAWLSFWIDAKAAPARVTLGITTVLTVTTMIAGIQDTLPVVTYAKAIDVWLAVCLLFVFFSLLEYGMANYLLVKQTSRETKDMDDAEQQPCIKMERNPHLETATDDKRCVRYWTAQRLDCCARLAYPMTFTVFNLFYWSFYIGYP